jgi:hypothetical protein
MNWFKFCITWLTRETIWKCILDARSNILNYPKITFKGAVLSTQKEEYQFNEKRNYQAKKLHQYQIEELNNKILMEDFQQMKR